MRVTVFVFVLLKHVTLAVRFQVTVCGRSPAGIADSNPAGATDVCVL
jgi:hypothetical protein